MSDAADNAGSRKKSPTFSDEALIACLAAGMSPRRAAVATGCSPRTVFRRLANEEFRRKVSAARTEAIARTVGKLTAIAIRAVKKLARLAQSKDEKVALGACRAILQSTFQGAEIGIFAEKVADLERRLAEAEERDKQEPVWQPGSWEQQEAAEESIPEPNPPDAGPRFQ